MGKWTEVARGEVSVEPQAEVISTRLPRVRMDSASRRSHKSWGRAAPAYHQDHRLRRALASRRRSSRAAPAPPLAATCRNPDSSTSRPAKQHGGGDWPIPPQSTPAGRGMCQRPRKQISMGRPGRSDRRWISGSTKWAATGFLPTASSPGIPRSGERLSGDKSADAARRPALGTPPRSLWDGLAEEGDHKDCRRGWSQGSSCWRDSCLPSQGAIRQDFHEGE